MIEHKLVIVMRTDLGMSKGKMVAQGAHAATMCFFRRPSDAEFDGRMQSWLTVGRLAKVCLKISGEEALCDIEYEARAKGMQVHVITDAGHTTFHNRPTKTCLAIGPDLASMIDAVTGHLKLL